MGYYTSSGIVDMSPAIITASAVIIAALISLIAAVVVSDKKSKKEIIKNVNEEGEKVKNKNVEHTEK